VPLATQDATAISFRNRICKTCGINFKCEPKKKGGKYCSQECLDKSSHKIKSCKPGCSVNDLSSRMVQYKDGTFHRQQICSKCKRTKYILTNPEEKKEETRFEKQVKDIKSRYGESFYTSKKWLIIRYKALSTYKRECVLCGSKQKLHVDHIKPRSKYPELQYKLDNLQILCSDCNLGKSNLDETDYRSAKE
jgi:5-methylcytosine-specific restriction endonuclease McrA